MKGQGSGKGLSTWDVFPWANLKNNIFEVSVSQIPRRPEESAFQDPEVKPQKSRRKHLVFGHDGRSKARREAATEYRSEPACLGENTWQVCGCYPCSSQIWTQNHTNEVFNKWSAPCEVWDTYPKSQNSAQVGGAGGFNTGGKGGGGEMIEGLFLAPKRMRITGSGR